MTRKVEIRRRGREDLVGDEVLEGGEQPEDEAPGPRRPALEHEELMDADYQHWLKTALPGVLEHEGTIGLIDWLSDEHAVVREMPMTNGGFVREEFIMRLAE